jgi:tripartite-type tricarboxylate transporter receptor subunit TctC
MLRHIGHLRGPYGIALLLTATIAATSPLSAQQFPSNLIRIVVAAASGTPPDIISRLVANDVAQSEGWRIIVEDKPGAMQTIAGAEVLKQASDGHTVISVSLPGMVAPALLPNVNYSLARDFAPVVKLSTSYNVLVVHPSLPVTSVSELVAHLKREPDKLSYSSGGFGTPAHLAGELFKLQTGVRATHVPYQALPQAIGDLISGTNQYMFVTTLPVIDLIATGKLRALAVTAPERISALKDVPTVAEAGFPDLVVQDWVGYLVKAGTSNDIVHRLNEAINKALAKPAVRGALAKLGAEPAGGSPDEFSKFIGSQAAYWAKVVQDSGMKMHQ